MGAAGRCGGKPAGLAWLLIEHGEALEADFEQYTRHDLLDLYRGRLSVRKAALLARQLPPGARVWRAIDSPAAWTTVEWLTADLVDVMQIANWQRGGGKGSKPKPVERPGATLRQELAKAKTQARARRFLARQQQQAQTRIEEAPDV